MKKRQTASEPEHASDLFAGVWVATDQAGEQMEIEIYNHPERGLWYCHQCAALHFGPDTSAND